MILSLSQLNDEKFANGVKDLRRLLANPSAVTKDDYVEKVSESWNAIPGKLTIPKLDEQKIASSNDVLLASNTATGLSNDLLLQLESPNHWQRASFGRIGARRHPE